ncbi:MAG: FHA domain-containing protein [Pseudomonadota bacterium]
MTLFRKVFQNQGHPASDEEALNESALREAFARASDKGDLLPRDVFAENFDEEISESQGDDAFEQDLDEELDIEGCEAASRREGPLRLASPLRVDNSSELSKDEEDQLETVHAKIAEAEETPEDAASVAKEPIVPEMDEQSLEEVEADEETRIVALDPTAAPSIAFADPAADVADGLSVGDEDLESAVYEAEAEEPTASAKNADKPDALDDIVAFAQAQLDAMDVETEDLPDPEPQEALDLSDISEFDIIPTPATTRSGRRAGRVKTRLLGFNRAGAAGTDPIAAPETTATQQREKFPVGWLVIVDGPGLGHSFSLFSGASVIGRGDDQVIKLDFGDTSISRSNHAAIAYDNEANKFYIGHGGKSNIIRKNARPVLSTEELHHTDLIRIGETTLRFVALCGSDFKWDTTGDQNAPGV